jgi:hypothetical protein
VTRVFVVAAVVLVGRLPVLTVFVVVSMTSMVVHLATLRSGRCVQG